jgi:dTDP-4-dehydrorhamnose 3,5-epimerase-like enzyme
MDLKPLAVKTDNRGSLIEAFKLPSDGLVFYVIIEPNETRGNHYHLRKTEHFLVVSGTAVMRVRDRTTENTMKVEVGGQNPMIMTIAPNNTHSITANWEGALVMVWCDEQFNEDDPDTYEEEV